MDSEAVKTQAREAASLLEDKAFLTAIIALRKQWFGELMNCSSVELHAALVYKLQALEAIPQQLQTYINSAKLAQKGNNNG